MICDKCKITVNETALRIDANDTYSLLNANYDIIGKIYRYSSDHFETVCNACLEAEIAAFRSSQT